MHLSTVVDDIGRCETFDEMRQVLQNTATDLGFLGFNFIDAGKPHLNEPFYLGTVPSRWEEEYKSNGFVVADPVMHSARRSNLPFRWSEVRSPPLRTGPRPLAARVMEAARDFGFTDGWVVPLHLADGVGRVSSCCTCFFWSGPLQRLQFLLSGQQHALHVVTIYWSERMLNLLARDRSRGLLGENVGDDRLSDRERQVLAWAARGKTAEDIADIMHLSAATVRGHIQKAMQRLNANSTTHAVALALMRGWIDM